MGLNEQTAELTVQEMKQLWGGNLPTWEEYKMAQKNGRVRVDKTVAAKAINIQGFPRSYFIIYGIITLWLGFLIFPVTLIAWFFTDFSGWWVLGSLAVSWFLVKVSREGHCEGLKHCAEKNPELYEIFVNNGAFLFGPNPN